MRVLGIESSCDETAAAVVVDGRTVLSNVVASQVEEHKLYGGVVPEIASRRHAEAISGVVRQALDEAGTALADIDAVAVTHAPGLIGALLVGVNFAKGLALSAHKPLVPAHHLRSHIAANYLAHPDLHPPFLCLVVSGGHSHIVQVEDYTRFSVLGRTRDDAAGECFDKAARAHGDAVSRRYPSGQAGPLGKPRRLCAAPSAGRGKRLRLQLFGVENGGAQPAAQRAAEGGRGKPGGFGGLFPENGGGAVGREPAAAAADTRRTPLCWPEEYPPTRDCAAGWRPTAPGWDTGCTRRRCRCAGTTPPWWGPRVITNISPGIWQEWI